MGGVFVSYRRSDTQGEAGRLFDDLVKHFGEDTIFMDVAAIEAGRDFRHAIEDGVAKCDVLLVVIGPEWLDAKDERGTRRLNDPSDYVRIETGVALKRNIRVIPVLVRGAKMPAAEQLPAELKDLAYRNCIELTHARWRSDIQLLTDALRHMLADANPTAAGASPGATATSPQPGTTPAGGASSAKSADPVSPPMDPAVLSRIAKELALHIGPIADIVVKRAAPHCRSVDELYRKVAEEIDSPEERAKFLRERTGIPSKAPPKVAAPAIVPRPAPTPAATPAPPAQSVPARPVKHDEPPPRPKPPTAIVESQNRVKYLLFVAGGAVLLILVIAVARFIQTKGAGSPQPAESSAPATKIAESTQAKTVTPNPPAETPAIKDQPAPAPALPTGGTAKSEPLTSNRVRLPENLSSKLRTVTAPLVYPVLARQARVQGTVVLDADISKDGAVEALRVISGPPLLQQAATDAALQFRYSPFIQNNKVVPFTTRITVTFHLTGK